MPSTSVAVVTGASRGLGRGIALALARDGFDLVLGYHRDAAGAGETVELVEALGRRTVTVAGDVSDEGTAKLLLEAAVTELGGLDVWVNNAGISVLAPIVDTSPSDFTRMIDVNLVGTLHGLQVAARWFLDAGRPGRIVNIASELGVQSFPFLGAYAATKFGVVGLTQAAAIELGPSGITVNAVCPGTAETDMVMAERATESGLTNASLDEVRSAYLAGIPTGRFCRPDDVGALVAYLASPGAAYVTGQSLCINGGSVLH